MKPKLTQGEQKTLQFYNAKAWEWAREHKVILWKDELIGFKKHLPKGKILEIGCGGGRDAKELIKLGFDYIGCDVSESFLEVARNENPGARFVLASVYDLPFKSNSFDGFWCAAVLLHIPKEKLNSSLREIRRVIKSGGMGFIVIKQGKNETFDGERYWSYYSDEEFSNKLLTNKFQILESKSLKLSEKTTFLVYVVRKI